MPRLLRFHNRRLLRYYYHGCHYSWSHNDKDPSPIHYIYYSTGQRIGVMRGLLYLTIAGVAIGSLYMIAKELMPSRMSPNYLFNEAFEEVKKNHEVGL